MSRFRDNEGQTLGCSASGGDEERKRRPTDEEGRSVVRAKRHYAEAN
jgi:hypothetical protein